MNAFKSFQFHGSSTGKDLHPPQYKVRYCSTVKEGILHKILLPNEFTVSFKPPYYQAEYIGNFEDWKALHELMRHCEENK